MIISMLPVIQLGINDIKKNKMFRMIAMKMRQTKTNNNDTIQNQQRKKKTAKLWENKHLKWESKKKSMFAVRNLDKAKVVGSSKVEFLRTVTRDIQREYPIAFLYGSPIQILTMADPT